MSEKSANLETEQITKDLNDLDVKENFCQDNDLSLDTEMESQIRCALNQQTIIQYRQYAAEQHSKEPHRQEELIKQLQEQYFQQYVTQVYEMQKVHQQQQLEQLKALHIQQMEDSGDTCNDDLSTLFPVLPLIPANLWTRKDISEFKANIMKNQRECCIKISSLSTATVRVPTHPEGRCVFWEFATDYYDLGFGVYFEWNVQPSDNITVHISESSDEEDLEEDVNTTAANGDELKNTEVNNSEEGPDDLESGARVRKGYQASFDELIPVYRRDCHQEVYCGSHQYPGRGTYVLKFDNSYSIWRSKWLYYRVYYTK